MIKELSANTTLAHYRIISKIGAGGMGEVYLAEDTRLGRQVALKVLPSEVAEDEEGVRRFEREAKSASALNHPNILTVYEIGDFGNSRYIATEFIKGETLRARLKNGPPSMREALDIATQVASALDAAHSAGIIHRDIKPENIMVRPDGLVKVLDFGLAKLTAPVSGTADPEAETLAKNLTRPGLIMGTLFYMSPEQVRGQRLDARSDIFSLGVVLYELFTGAAAFARPTRGDVIAAILTETPPLDKLPHELRQVVAKSLHKEKEERYQTSREMLVDLKGLSREMELSAHAERIASQTNEPAHANTTAALTARRFSLIHALAILLVAGLCMGAVLWYGFGGNVVAPSSLKPAEVATWPSAPGEVYSTGSFSPDGARVAFVKNDGGSPNIYFKQTTADTPPIQTTKDEFRNEQPIWSPDGEEIAFFSTRGNQWGLWRVPYSGGTPTLIKTVTAGDTKPRYWSKSGALYYEEQRNLYALDLKSGRTTPLTNFDSATASVASLDISPDETQIVYIKTEGEQWGVWTVPSRGGEARRIFDSAAEIRNAIWHSDSRRILYSALTDGVFQIFVTDADANPPAQLTFGERDSLALDVAADGAKILYGSSKEDSDVWSVNVATGAESEFAADINSELWPSVAPDNKTVAFSSVKNLSQGDKLARGAIMIKTTDADAPPAQLVADGFIPAWSPDGKQVAFMRVAGEVYDLWVVKALGGDAKQLTKGGVPSVQYNVLPYNRTQVAEFGWSPDGGGIVYASSGTGTRNLRLVSADGANDAQLTANNDANLHFFSPLWSSDGKSIAYTSKTNKALGGKLNYGVWLIDVETKTARALYQAENFLRLLGWSEDGKGLIVASVKGSPRGGPMAEISVVEIAVASGEPRPRPPLQSAYLYNLHLSPDGRMLAYVAQQDGKDNLWLRPARGVGAAKKLTSNNNPRLYFSSLAWSPDGKAIYFGKQSRYSLLSMITNFK